MLPCICLIHYLIPDKPVRSLGVNKFCTSHKTGCLDTHLYQRRSRVQCHFHLNQKPRKPGLEERPYKHPPREKLVLTAEEGPEQMRSIPRGEACHLLYKLGGRTKSPGDREARGSVGTTSTCSMRGCARVFSQGQKRLRHVISAAAEI